MDEQLEALIEALDARNIQSAGDLERYDRESLDLHRLGAGVHLWFCGTTGKHDPDSPKRPAIRWACERGAEAIAKAYAKDPAR